MFSLLQEISEKLKPVREQATAMGAKVEVNDGQHMLQLHLQNQNKNYVETIAKFYPS